MTRDKGGEGVGGQLQEREGVLGTSGKGKHLITASETGSQERGRGSLVGVIIVM